MDIRTESRIKSLLFILLLVVVIQFILILGLCSRDYMDCMNKETGYEAEPEPDTLRINSPSGWQTDGIFSYDDLYFEP